MQQSINRFTLGPDTYVVSSLADGRKVLRNVSAANGQGTEVGSAGSWPEGSGVRLTSWPAGVTSTAGDKAGVAASGVSGTDTAQLVDAATFRTAQAPLKSGSFSVVATLQDGSSINATANASGEIVSGTAVVGETPGSYGVFGTVDYQYGVVEVRFGRRVPASMATAKGVVDASYLGLPGVQYVQSVGAQADTLRYNASGYYYQPVDSTLLGLNPVRLPADGRVPVFRAGSVVVIHHTAETTPATVSNGQTINCGRARLGRVRVIGANGQTITTGYTANLDAGTVTFNNVTGYSQPVKVQHRIEDTALLRDAQLSGLLRFNRPLTHDFPVGSYVSSALLIGDMRARVSKLFDQGTFSLSTPVWSDTVQGSGTAASFNDTLYPVVVTNAGAITERWALVFTSTTSYNVVGEHLGVIDTGSTGTECAPMNPAAGVPYFRVPAAGWGNGWSAGNALRINTVAASEGIWVARVIKPSSPEVTDDSFLINARGDVDRP
jgi:hypothetical protein